MKKYNCWDEKTLKRLQTVWNSASSSKSVLEQLKLPVSENALNLRVSRLRRLGYKFKDMRHHNNAGGRPKNDYTYLDKD